MELYKIIYGKTFCLREGILLGNKAQDFMLVMLLYYAHDPLRINSTSMFL